jgi:predicted deacylase
MDPLRRVHELATATGASTAGRSVEGRAIHRVELGPGDAERVTVVLGGIHAMEWIGVDAACALAEELERRPPADRRVWIFPLVNPDGAAAVVADRRAGRRRFQRANARGVDLNRNWPTHWTAARLGTRLIPFLGHSGAGPASEPEVRTVLDALDEAVADGLRVDRALSLHSFGRMILHPYGGVWRRPTDYAAHRRAAEAMQASIDGLRYRIRQSSRWVPGAFAPGMELDHLHDRYGALSLLVELGAGGLQAFEPRTWVEPTRWFYPPGSSAEVARVLPALRAFVAPEATAARPASGP